MNGAKVFVSSRRYLKKNATPLCGGPRVRGSLSSLKYRYRLEERAPSPRGLTKVFAFQYPQNVQSSLLSIRIKITVSPQTSEP